VLCKPVTVTTGTGKQRHKVTEQRCQTSLESSPATFKIATGVAAQASQRRDGHLYATGTLRGGRLVLHAGAGLRPGHYTLWLTHGRKSAHETVTITA
jgi:hypothetical protein